MPDSTRKAIREAEPRSESVFEGKDADRVRRAFQILATPLVRDAAEAEQLADMIQIRLRVTALMHRRIGVGVPVGSITRRPQSRILSPPIEHSWRKAPTGFFSVFPSAAPRSGRRVYVEYAP